MSRVTETPDIIQRLDEIKHAVDDIKQSIASGAVVSNKDRQRAEFATKVRSWMLSSKLNIKFLDDDIEGDIYEFVANKLWDVVFD
jgi:hypothetical protein